MGDWERTGFPCQNGGGSIMSQQRAMTRDEFKCGWLLLIIQDWGWRYNQTDAQGRPTATAVAQMNFYFERLRGFLPEAWLAVAGRFAEGNKWPNVEDLRVALQHEQTRRVKALPNHSRQQGEPMPREVREMIDRMARKR